MPPRRLPSDDPREWLNRARSDLSMAKAQGVGIYYEDLCFHAQQAAEKAIKAVLLHRGIRFPYVHDIGELIRLLRRKTVSHPTDSTNPSITHRRIGSIHRSGCRNRSVASSSHRRNAAPVDHPNGSPNRAAATKIIQAI